MTHRASLLLIWIASLALFWSPLATSARLSLTDDRYTHIAVIPPIVVCLLYWKRKNVFINERWNPRLGLPLIVLGAVVAITGLYVGQSVSLSLEIAGLVVIWMAGFLLCYGTKAFTAARFPLLFLLLMVPVPQVLMDKIIFVLQMGSTNVTYTFFKVGGVPVFRHGVTFDLPQVGIEVAKECSSIHSSWALFITGLLVGHFLLRSLRSKVYLSLLTLPIAVFTNAIRIFTIWFLGIHVDIGFLYGNLHHRGGALFSLISVFLLLACVAALRKVEHPTLSSARAAALFRVVSLLA